MNILILHAMGNPRRWLHSVATFELGMPGFDPAHNYLVHNASLPLPEFVKNFEFDLILINSSFLTAVFDRARLNELRENYEFIKNSGAFKVAMPQDDYYCSEELDKLVTEWRIDLLYTVCPEYWDILYPRYQQAGGAIKLGFTGYITPEMLEKSVTVKPVTKRKFDLTYRASGKPSFPNKLATLKANIGIIFTENIQTPSLNVDIAAGKKAMISGSAWWDFIEDSRCVLGSLSGSSNLIRNHEITDAIVEYRSTHPAATDDEIIDACIPAEDSTRIYEAISPRIIEAGLLKAVQLLVPGSYSGILKPYEDYIPIKGNFLEGDMNISNKEELVEVLNDVSLQEKITTQCKKTLLNSTQLHLTAFFQDVFNECYTAGKTSYTGKEKFKNLKVKYTVVMAPFYRLKFFAGDAIHYLQSLKR